jgi:hypothetical protein
MKTRTSKLDVHFSRQPKGVLMMARIHPNLIKLEKFGGFLGARSTEIGKLVVKNSIYFGFLARFQGYKLEKKILFLVGFGRFFLFVFYLQYEKLQKPHKTNLLKGVL